MARTKQTPRASTGGKYPSGYGYSKASKYQRAKLSNLSMALPPLGTVFTKRDKNGRPMKYRMERGKHGLKMVRLPMKRDNVRPKRRSRAVVAADRLGSNTTNAESIARARAHFESQGTARGRARDKKRFGKYPAKFSTYMKEGGPKRYDWPTVDDGL